MRLILISGAGLSATSGLPTYESVKNKHLYQKLLSSSGADFVHAAEQVETFLKKFSPSKVHREVKRVEEVCEYLDIEFIHYTLNVDDLIEQSGGTVIHIHGCITDKDTLSTHLNYPHVELSDFAWNKYDVVMFLGVSEEGLPLLYIESMIEQQGGLVIHYNQQIRTNLSGRQIQLNLEDLSCTNILSHLLLSFRAAELSETDIVHVAQFSIAEREYEIYFSPRSCSTMSPEALVGIEDETGLSSDSYTYEIKFDLAANRENNTYYERPLNFNFSLREMHILGEILVAFIHSHAAEFEVSLYIAETHYSKLSAFYKRLAKSTTKKIECQHWLINQHSGEYHAFKPTW